MGRIQKGIQRDFRSFARCHADDVQHTAADHRTEIGDLRDGFERFDGFVGKRTCFGKFYVLRKHERNGKLIAAAFGEQNEALAKAQGGRAYQEEKRKQKCGHTVIQNESQRLFKAGIESLTALLLRLDGAAHNARDHGRNDCDGDDQTCEQRERHRQNHIHKDLSGEALHKEDGDKHADGRKRGGGDGAKHLLRTRNGGLPNGKALRPQAVDVFDDDDGVIHEHADADGKAGHGDDVHRDAAEIHQHERKQNGYGDADADDQRGTEVA